MNDDAKPTNRQRTQLCRAFNLTEITQRRQEQQGQLLLFPLLADINMNQRADKNLIIVLVVIFIMCRQCIAKQDSPRHIDSSSMLIGSIADMESKDDRDALSLWADSEMIKALSETAITDDYIKSLYSEFKSAMVTPPNPDTYKVYGIDNAEEALERVSQLGRRVHNLGLAMSDVDFKKYGGLIKCMRDAL